MRNNVGINKLILLNKQKLFILTRMLRRYRITIRNKILKYSNAQNKS